MITYGTNPGMVVPIDGAVPDRAGDAAFRQGARVHGTAGRRAAARQAGERRVRRQLHERATVAICAQAASVLRGRKVASGVRMLVVPGSQQVKREAEAEGLAQVFTRRRRRVARVRLLDVPRHERRHRSRPASTP